MLVPLYVIHKYTYLFHGNPRHAALQPMALSLRQSCLHACIGVSAKVTGTYLTDEIPHLKRHLEEQATDILKLHPELEGLMIIQAPKTIRKK